LVSNEASSLSGLVFVLGWEPIAVALPGYLKRLSVPYYVQGLVPHAMPQDSPLSLIQDLPGVPGSERA
jgi:hypothetical protein